MINPQPDNSELNLNTSKSNFKGFSRPDGSKQACKSIHIDLRLFSLKKYSQTLACIETLEGGVHFKFPVAGLHP